ncbi:hypothetical protein CJ231_01750 [Hoylesella buccalis]|uniref:Uncharacterized protein n=1 Tax=Hoylesella buccalis TaxID=28127 RepID=A0A2N6QTZ5_9BACT|nr:hypothetical protein CJ231_01750 [Hoylesella buccalis]
MGLNGDMATAFMLFFIKSKIDFQILTIIFRGCQKKVVILHQIGCALAREIYFLCIRFALFLHKIGCASI